MSLSKDHKSVTLLSMPITKSAKKALRGSARKRRVNDARRREMRTQVKTLKKVVLESESNENGLSVAYKAIDKAAKQGVIKKNTAARKKSRLAKLIRRK